ncbi:hypothetical protein HGRIS_005348 [Hohenbuehelia grisea]|uniref:Uncharacterized protein n=1 Tax=Hohenbuehelia grisea TaxID=104357 RepID=A0ABR3JGD4_9AGAR
MPFFEGAKDFQMHNPTLNAIAGDQTVNNKNFVDNRQNCGNTTTHNVSNSHNQTSYPYYDHSQGRTTNNFGAPATINNNTGGGTMYSNSGHGSITSVAGNSYTYGPNYHHDQQPVAQNDRLRPNLPTAHSVPAVAAVGQGNTYHQLPPPAVAFAGQQPLPGSRYGPDSELASANTRPFGVAAGQSYAYEQIPRQMNVNPAALSQQPSPQNQASSPQFFSPSPSQPDPSMRPQPLPVPLSPPSHSTNGLYAPSPALPSSPPLSQANGIDSSPQPGYLAPQTSSSPQISTGSSWNSNQSPQGSTPGFGSQNGPMLALPTEQPNGQLNPPSSAHSSVYDDHSTRRKSHGLWCRFQRRLSGRKSR